jgi:hypothetical protein
MLSAIDPDSSAQFSNDIFIAVFNTKTGNSFSCTNVVNSNSNPESDCGGKLGN